MSKKTKKPTNPHDRGYKTLFSNPVILRQLFETCVDEPWVKELDFSSLEYLNTEHVDKRLTASQNDMLFQIRFGNNPALLLVILEFQSTTDRFMALRVLHYLCSVYLSFIKMKKQKKQKVKTLPPVFPIVLYNGKRPWKAPLEISKLIHLPKNIANLNTDESCEPLDIFGSLKAYTPSFKYLCIDEGRIDPAILEEKKTLISALFFMERTRIDGIKLDMQKFSTYVGKYLDNDENRAATQQLMEHVEILLGCNILEGDEIIEGKIKTGKDVSTMLEKTIQEIRRREREIGRARGIEIGEARGEARGEHEQKVKTARKLLAKGYPPKEVAEIVELDEEEIHKLLH